MTVLSVESTDDFNHQLKQAKEKIVIVDFYATWCGPCKNIAPFVEELSNKHPDVLFLKVDTTKLSEVSTKYSVMSLPTFMSFKNEEKLAEFKGADRERLVDMVENGGVPTMAQQSNVDYPRMVMFVILILYMFYKNGYFEALKAYF